MKPRTKLQSSMEYLITWGWAIVILVVSLAILYSLGVFNSNTSLATTCIPTSGFFCQKPILTTNGNLSFLLGQNLGVNFYNVAIACAASQGYGSLPNPRSAIVLFFANGLATNVISSGVNSLGAGGLSLANTQIVSINSLTCFGITANALRNQPIGAQFSGAIYINYTASPAPPSAATNPLLTQRIATVTLKVV